MTNPHDDHYYKKTERPLWMALTAVLLVTILFLTFQLMGQPQYKLLQAGSLAANRGPLDKITYVYRTIVANFINEIDEEQLAITAIKAMLDSLNDPYSSYLDKDTARYLNDTVQGNFGGLGITITLNKDSFLEVISVQEPSPAHKAGLLVGDLITAVDGIDLASFANKEVITLLRGPVGSRVTLTVLRAGKSSDISLKRERIDIESVKGVMLNKTIGYLKIDQFHPFTQQQLHQALDTMKGATSYIIDLRNNGGGSYEAAVAIANDFLSEGTIVSTQGRRPIFNKTEKADKKTVIATDKPIVVLINQYSASASEVLAGALADHGRATLVGSTSYGKSHVQQVFPLSSDYHQSFKLTVSSYFTPKGIDINQKGITPDIIVEPLTEASPDAIDNFTIDPALQKAIEVALAATQQPRQQ